MADEKFRLIDTDAMLGRHPQRDGGSRDVESFLAMMDRFGIDEAVVGHMLAWMDSPVDGNDRITKLIDGHPRLHACWVILPDTCGEIDPPAEFVAAAVDAGVAAVRAYPEDHGYDLDGPDVADLLDAVTEAGLPLLVDLEQTSLGAVERIATLRPSLQIVVCRTGYRILRPLAGVFRRTENVHIGMANMSSNCGIEWLVDRFGARRIFFGTAVPIRDPADVVTRLLWSELDDDAVAAIGAGNAESILRLPSRAV